MGRVGGARRGFVGATEWHGLLLQAPAGRADTAEPIDLLPALLGSRPHVVEDLRTRTPRLLIAPETSCPRTTVPVTSLTRMGPTGRMFEPMPRTIRGRHRLGRPSYGSLSIRRADRNAAATHGAGQPAGTLGRRHARGGRTRLVRSSGFGCEGGLRCRQRGSSVRRERMRDPAHSAAGTRATCPSRGHPGALFHQRP